MENASVQGGGRSKVVVRLRGDYGRNMRRLESG